MAVIIYISNRVCGFPFLQIFASTYYLQFFYSSHCYGERLISGYQVTGR